MPFWKRNKPEVEPVKAESPKAEAVGVIDLELGDIRTKAEKSAIDSIEQRAFQRKAPKMEGVAMDSCEQSYRGEYNVVNIRALNYFAASSSFIGYANMAIIAQNWLIQKGCSLMVKDATKKWYEISVGDDTELTAEQVKLIERMDKDYKLKENVNQAVSFNNVFGIRHVLYKNTNPNFDYSLPFNPDSWGPGSYAGMAQIDPYWITPEIDAQDLTDPTRIDFYEPTYWNINGKRYHKSHFVILTGEDVADNLKPTYRYGGISKTQMAYERCYAAERSANEAPQLLMTKRLLNRKMDLAKAKANAAGLFKALSDMVSFRDNYGINVTGKDEELNQLDTGLADVHDVITGQFELVAATYGIPVSKLMGTGHGGLGTGETDEDYYISNLEQLQGNECERIINAHYDRLIPSEIKPRLGVEPEIDLSWRPLKVMSAKEIAEINNMNANTDAIIEGLGAIDALDIAKRLINDKHSGYTGMEMPIIEEPDDDDDDLITGEVNYGAEENEQPQD